jgi:hypothetical protein
LKKVKLQINNEYIIIELKNSSVTNLWLDTIRPVTNKTIRTVNHPHYIDPKTSVDKISNAWNKIKENIKIIESEFSVSWPEEVPHEFNFDQQILNRYHRYFAQATMFYNRWQIDHDYTFEEIDTARRQRFSDLLEEINFAIHDLESHTLTPVVDIYKDKLKKLYVDFNPVNWVNLPPGVPHTTDKEYNVCIAMEVHGKNYLQAFIDNDVPDQPDVHGQRGMFGRIDIYVDDTVFDILESKEFKNWLGTNNIKDYALVQLGKVIDSSRPLIELYNNLSNGASMEIVEL